MGWKSRFQISSQLKLGAHGLVGVSVFQSVSFVFGASPGDEWFHQAISSCSSSQNVVGKIMEHLVFWCYKGYRSWFPTNLVMTHIAMERSTMLLSSVNHLFRLGPSTNHGYVDHNQRLPISPPVAWWIHSAQTFATTLLGLRPRIFGGTAMVAALLPKCRVMAQDPGQTRVNMNPKTDWCNAECSQQIGWSTFSGETCHEFFFSVIKTAEDNSLHIILSVAPDVLFDLSHTD